MKKIIRYLKNKFKFSWYYNIRVRRDYISLLLIPTIQFIYDSQGNMTLKLEDEEIIDSVIEISLDINWLWLNIGGDLTIKTNKPIIKVDF